MKEVVVNDPPRRISGLEFCALSPQDILKGAEVEVSSRNLYDINKGRIPHQNGPLDTRLVSIAFRFVLQFDTFLLTFAF